MDKITHHFKSGSTTKIYGMVLVAAIVLGIVAGYGLAATSAKNPTTGGVLPDAGDQTLTTAQKDNQTFRDFAEGIIQKKPAPKNNDYSAEGTHVLVRVNAVPVALTSSVVDLSKYEGKKVKVFGETQKAIKEGWLMDVGKVEIQ